MNLLTVDQTKTIHWYVNRSFGITLSSSWLLLKQKRDCGVFHDEKPYKSD